MHANYQELDVKDRARVETPEPQLKDVSVPTFMLVLLGLCIVWCVGMYYSVKALHEVRHALDEHTAVLNQLYNT